MRPPKERVAPTSCKGRAASLGVGRGAGLLLALASTPLAVACEDAPCGPNRQRVADSCVAIRAADDGGAAVPLGDELRGTELAEADEVFATTTSFSLPACANRLLGRYAVRDITYEFGEPLGKQEVLATTNYNIVEIAAKDGELRLHTELCLQETLWGDSYSVVPKAYIGYLGKPPVVSLDVDCDAQRWQAQSERMVAGFTPTLPRGCEDGQATSSNWQGTCRCPRAGSEAKLPLANDADECRVLDPDADRRPGLTVTNRLFGFEAWVSGVFVHEGYAAGSIAADGYHTGAWNDLGSESVLLACDPVLLALTGGECPQPHLAPCPQQARNEMVFVPIDETVVCGVVTATLDRLFGELPKPTPPDVEGCL